MTKVYKRRIDYKPLLWIPNKTFLEILIYNEYTVVKSQVTYKKNNDQGLYRTNLDSHLELNGENLVTQKFQLIIDNNPPKDIKIDKLKKLNEAIQISVPINSKIIKTITEVKIFPSKNNALEGIYQSNNMFCTQCEPEGFRKITWFTDRPDCLSLFTVKLEVSEQYKTILSNGNLIEEGIIKNKNGNSNRLYKVWHDPFPKPSYLFALVVGNLEVNTSKFLTSSKKKLKSVFILKLEINTSQTMLCKV